MEQKDSEPLISNIGFCLLVFTSLRGLNDLRFFIVGLRILITFAKINESWTPPDTIRSCLPFLVT